MRIEDPADRRLDRRAVLRLAAAGSASLSIGGLSVGCSVLRPSKTSNPAPSASSSPSAVATSATTAPSPSPTPTPALPPADMARVQAVLTRLRTAGSQTAQARVVQPSVRKPLRRLQRDQHAHAVALARLAELPAPPAPTPTPTAPAGKGRSTGKSGRGKTGRGKSGRGKKGADKPQRPTAAAVYASLGATEKTTADGLRSQALDAESGELAALFASAAASAACWHRWLAGRAG